MIIDNTIKKCIVDGTDVKTIQLDDSVVWKKELTTSTVIEGITFHDLDLVSTNRANIESFKLAPNDIATPDSGTVDISEAQNGTIIMWYDNTNAILYYRPVGIDKILLNKNCWNMFRDMTSLKEIPLLDTSNTDYMVGMFCGTSLTTIPKLDTSKVTNMNYMFMYCTNLTTIPELDTSNVISTINMFRDCVSLTSVPELNTSKVNDFMAMFYNCSSLTSIPSSIDTRNAIDMGGMFRGCTSLKEIPLLDTSKVTNMNAMFEGCSFTTLDISSFDTSNVTKMGRMFQDCTDLVTINYGNNFVNTKCIEFDVMYKNCPANKPDWTNGTWDVDGAFVKNA